MDSCILLLLLLFAITYQANWIRPAKKMRTAMIREPDLSVRQKQHRLSGPSRAKSSSALLAVAASASPPRLLDAGAIFLHATDGSVLMVQWARRVRTSLRREGGAMEEIPSSSSSPAKHDKSQIGEFKDTK